MLVELGPIPTDDVVSWTRFARRLLVELRTEPAELSGIATEDFLDQWALLINQWADATVGTTVFRWSQALDDEVAEFLLHGFERCLHSPAVLDRITEQEEQEHRGFTLHLLQAFVDGLAVDQTHEHYVDQIKASFGGSVDL